MADEFSSYLHSEYRDLEISRRRIGTGYTYPAFRERFVDDLHE